MALQGEFQGRGCVVAGDADEARELLFTGLQQSLEHAAFGLDAGQVVFIFERVDVDQIHLVDLQVLQAPLDGGLNRGAVARADLGSEEEALSASARLEAPAQQLFAAAARIAVGGVEVSDAGLRRLGDEADGILFAAGGIETLTAAEGQRGDPFSGFPQQARGQLRLRARQGFRNAGQSGRALQEFTPGSTHIRPSP